MDPRQGHAGVTISHTLIEKILHLEPETVVDSNCYWDTPWQQAA